MKLSGSLFNLARVITNIEALLSGSPRRIFTRGLNLLWGKHFHRRLWFK